MHFFKQLLACIGLMDLHTACLVAVRESMLDFYSDCTTRFLNTLGLDVIQVLGVSTIFNLAKVNRVPCMYAAAFPLGQRVDDWVV